MQHVLIFLPDLRFKKQHSSLYGVIVRCETGIAVYILGSSCNNNCNYLSSYPTLGDVNFNSKVSKKKNKYHFWVSIQLSSALSIQKIKFHSDSEASHITVILYDKDYIKKSQLLGINYQNVQPKRTDYIFRLIRHIQEEPTICCNEIESRSKKTIVCFVMKKLYYLQKSLLNCIKGNFLEYLFKHSSFGSHSFNILETFTKVSHQMSLMGYLDVQYTNYIVARICDALLGELIIYHVMSYTSSDELFAVLIQFQEVCNDLQLMNFVNLNN